MDKFENAFRVVRDKYVHAYVQSLFLFKRTPPAHAGVILTQKSLLQGVLIDAFGSEFQCDFPEIAAAAEKAYHDVVDGGDFGTQEQQEDKILSLLIERGVIQKKERF